MKKRKNGAKQGPGFPRFGRRKVREILLKQNVDDNGRSPEIAMLQFDYRL